MSDDQPPLRATILRAVIHLNNEQPLLADLFGLPEPSDLGLLCTNLRTLNGKRPVFADHLESTFFFPYQHIRFLEIPPGADGRRLIEAPAAPVAEVPPEEPEEDLQLDEDFLRRIRDV
jgi:hypothetical protein